MIVVTPPWLELLGCRDVVARAADRPDGALCRPVSAPARVSQQGWGVSATPPANRIRGPEGDCGVAHAPGAESETRWGACPKCAFDPDAHPCRCRDELAFRIVSRSLTSISILTVHIGQCQAGSQLEDQTDD
jgi:hypothetical protein